MFSEMPLLSLVIWLPIVGGLIVLAAANAGNGLVRWLALAVALLTFAVSLPLYTQFDAASFKMQFEEKAPWIRAFNINYHLGIDGISQLQILLTTFTTVLVIISAWEVIQFIVAQFLAAFLILEGLMVGVYAALDAALFYVFWEAMLIPMFLIIGVWGGVRRVYAAIKFFLYTFLGSVFLLVAILYLFFQSDSFAILDYYKLPLTMTEQVLLFLAFLIAFAVKVPMWPVHTWLPDAHVEAPTGGSVILAAFMLTIAPDASAHLDWLVIGLSLVAIVYIALVALVQEDMKKLIAYSSIAHMGFVTLGFFLVFPIFAATGSIQGAALGFEGAVVQLISHGFISGALFLCVGVMYDRLHSRNISDYGGVANTMPTFAALMVLFAMANAGLPGTSGFVGEFMVILSAFKANFWLAFLAGTTLILGAAYTLWLVKRVLFGEIKNEGVAALRDINAREGIVLGSLAIVVLLLGVWPAPVVDVLHTSVNSLLQHVVVSKL